MSKLRIGKKHSEESKIKIGEAQKGKVFSDEAREKMSKKAKERKQDLSGQNNPFFGKYHSEEAKKKMSKTKKGKYTRIKFSDERKMKISEAKKEYWRKWRLEHGK